MAQAEEQAKAERQKAEQRAREQQEKLEQQNRQRQEQTRQQEQTAKPQKEQEQKPKDYSRYGNQGLTAEQVEIRYNATMDSLKQEQDKTLGKDNLTPRERFKAIQEKNKDNIAQRQQERMLEKGGHDR